MVEGRDTYGAVVHSFVQVPDAPSHPHRLPAPVEVVEPVSHPADTEPRETITDIDGGLSVLVRWMIRFWLRITIRRRR